jgi:hypothetical protein
MSGTPCFEIANSFLHILEELCPGETLLLQGPFCLSFLITSHPQPLLYPFLEVDTSLYQLPHFLSSQESSVNTT